MSRSHETLDATHDPALRSWVAAANTPSSDFPIQNLPFGVFRRHGAGDAQRCGIAIGDQILDVAALTDLLHDAALPAARACAAPVLNELMALGREPSSALRAQLSKVLSEDAGAQARDAVRAALLPMTDADLLLPVRIGGYTDFFASIHHATNAGRLFRPDQPLLPNYKHVPVAYNGRANSVRVSGVPVQRPCGQVRPAGSDAPVYAPTTRLDHEVELGVFIGRGSAPGQPLGLQEAWQNVFGVCLLNDWSARDIQAWEYQPLGPFLGKSFATSISPWVITADALKPFRTAVAARADEDPAPLPHLRDIEDQRSGGLAIQIEASLRSAHMREAGLPATRLSRSDTSTLYWTVAQMLVHHTSNGCALDTGDLLGSGTVSGATPDALGSLLEITRGGAQLLDLPSGEQRRFIEDGDEIVFTACCEAPGHVRIGFGECRAAVLPARTSERSAGT